jgi:phosphatidylinositol alpha-1,6-mannosyltransferase
MGADPLFEAAMKPVEPISPYEVADTRCLLIASIFAPIHGGSAVVYESLARLCPPGAVFVFAPWRDYSTGSPIEGTEEHDRKVYYTVNRTELVRPLSGAPPSSALHSALRLLVIDLPLAAKILWRVARIVRDEKIDVICVGELTSGSWIAQWCKRLFGCKVINYIHGEEITVDMPYRFYGRARARHLAKADAVVAVSEFTRDALVRIMKVDPTKIRLIHNGVDTDRFQPGPPEPALVERHGLAGKFVLLTVGRLVPRKGIDHVLKALPQALARVPNLHYVIVGVGPYRDELEALTDSLGLRPHVTFAGRIPDEELAAYYRTCDLFLMPNREMPDGDTEGFGLVFLEANACGKPVIGGRAGGAVEAVRDGENGLLVDGWKPEEITEAISRLATDRALAVRIAARAIEVARAASAHVQARSFYDLCRKVAGRPAE